MKRSSKKKKHSLQHKIESLLQTGLAVAGLSGILSFHSDKNEQALPPQRVNTITQTIDTNQQLDPLDVLRQLKSFQSTKTKFNVIEFIDFLKTDGVNYALQSFSDVKEAFYNLLKSNPKVASVFFANIDADDFPQALEKARRQGIKTFLWNKHVYTTTYEGSQKEQLDAYGLVNEQLQDLTWWQARLARNLKHFEYDTKGELLRRAYDIIVLDKTEEADDEQVDEQDYYNIYMGKPQQHKTLDISDYKPKPEEKNGRGLANPSVIFKEPFISKDMAQYWAVIAKTIEQNDGKPLAATKRTLGRFKISLGHDQKGSYLCYHDVWDLAPGDLQLDFGKPFEVYDRVYFNPKDVDAAYKKQRETLSRCCFHISAVPMFKRDGIDCEDVYNMSENLDILTYDNRDGTYYEASHQGKVVKVVKQNYKDNSRICMDLQDDGTYLETIGSDIVITRDTLGNILQVSYQQEPCELDQLSQKLPEEMVKLIHNGLPKELIQKMATYEDEKSERQGNIKATQEGLSASSEFLKNRKNPQMGLKIKAMRTKARS